VLLATLAVAAGERGVRRFRGEILASNHPMRALLGEVGAVVRRESGDGTLVFDVDLGEQAAEANRPSSPALARLLREAASSMAIFVRSVLPSTSDRDDDRDGEKR
jgi:hypothetical protein